MECKVIESVSLPTHILFMGEVVSAYTDERFLTEGKPDMHKMRPFMFIRPEGTYWTLGEKVGEAYQIGKQLRNKGR
jgi:flavin reductase (DIM6/NTAB) family NADH-FMN oxidoreductase RutF